MRLLLDTHLLLWAAGEPDKLPEPARAAIEDRDNELLFSAASIWEVAIKATLGRKDFAADPHLLRRGLVEARYVELPVSGLHAAGVASLPPIHRDPFDRVLVAQAIAEGVVLMTVDGTVARYPGPIRLM